MPLSPTPTRKKMNKRNWRQQRGQPRKVKNVLFFVSSARGRGCVHSPKCRNRFIVRRGNPFCFLPLVDRRGYRFLGNHFIVRRANPLCFSPFVGRRGNHFRPIFDHVPFIGKLLLGLGLPSIVGKIIFGLSAIAGEIVLGFC